MEKSVVNWQILQKITLLICRSSRSQLFFKKMLLKISNIHMKTPVLESLFNKVTGLLSCEYCEVFTNSFFIKHSEHFCWLRLYMNKRIQTQKELFPDILRINVLENFIKFSGKYLCPSLFFIRLQTFNLQFYEKDTPTQVFF